MTLQLITVRKAAQREPGLSRHARKSLENNQLNSNRHTSWTFRARKGLGDHLLLFLHFTEEEKKAQQGTWHPQVVQISGASVLGTPWDWFQSLSLP